MARRIPAVLALLAVSASASWAQKPAPARAEGEGPFSVLVIRGAIMIDGTGSPPVGPVDITIRGNRIASIVGAGTPGLPAPDRQVPAGARVIEAAGKFVLPGFVDIHLHTGDPNKTPEAEYIYKLWLAHGITAGRGVEYGPFDFAMMECGQYNEKWEAIHMMPEQTVQASLDLRSKHTMPIHWGAFDLSLHTWTDPVDRLIKESESKGVPVSTPQLGTRFEIADHPTQSWWKMVP